MKVNRPQKYVAIAVLSLLLVIPSMVEADRPSGTVRVESKSVALGIGVSWGDGLLNFKGKTYSFSISGLSVVDLGMSNVESTGEVYRLKNIKDFSGNFVAAEAGFTLAGGVTGITMRNQNGVVMKLRSVTQGAQLTLAAKGLKVKLN
jgi:hypothetical protein